jgi:uncharacterized protein YbjT (DUF2867 family)
VDAPVQKNSVLILGATGLVGGECLRRFMADSRFSEVMTLTRRPLETGPDSGRHRNHVIDFDDPQSYRDHVAANVVVCALGTTIKKAGSREMFRKVDFSYALQLARRARAAGARHLLLVSAKGASSGSRFFYNRVKGELEAALGGLGFERLSIFRPSLLKGSRDEFRAGEEIGNVMAGALSFLIPRQWQPTPAGRLADAIVWAAVKGPPGIQIYESGDLLTGLDGRVAG